MMEDVLKQCLRKETMVTSHLRESNDLDSFLQVTVFTLDKLGFWEYLARFSLDKFINGPSGLVNMEAWRHSETKNHSKYFMLFNSPYKITKNK